MNRSMMVGLRYMAIGVVAFAVCDYVLMRLAIKPPVSAYVGVGVMAVVTLLASATAYREGRRSVRRSED
jgi:hypothetical protein